MKSIERNPHLPQTEAGAGSGDPDLARLARLIRARAPHDGSFECP